MTRHRLRFTCGRKQQASGDEGAILIVAILIVTTIALVVGTVLTRGSGSLLATVALRNVAGTSYAADSAANIAINDLRTGFGFTAPDKYDNALSTASDPSAGRGCFGNAIPDNGTDTLSLNGFYPVTGTVGQSSAYIECSGETGTGAQGSPVQINNMNTPGQAILTLGAKSSNGLQFGSAAAETDYIHGSVTSNSYIKSKGTLNVTGSGVKINAAAGCTGNVQVNGSAYSCGSQGIPDPNYPAPTTTPVLPQPPTCPSVNGGPEVYYPGLYTVTPDKLGVIPTVQTITVSKGTTAGTLTPSLSGYGTGGSEPYNVTPADLQTALRTAWGIDVTVTGSPVTADAPGTYTLTFPTILGNLSKMGMTTAGLGPGKSATTSVVTAGSNTCPKTPGWLYFAPASSSTTGVYYFNWGSNVWSLGVPAVGGTLSTTQDGTTIGGTSIAPAGNAPAPTAPGACVNPIKDSGAVGIAMAFGGASQMHLSGDPSASTKQEFCATYSATSIPTVVYGLKSPVGSGATMVPAQNGCIVSSSPCPMITASNGDKGVFYFEGFIYAPWAYVSLQANNIDQPFFNFGMLTDSLFVGGNPSITCKKCAFINLPDSSPGYGTKSTTVLIKVHVCLNSPSVTDACKSNTPSLIARVQLWDIGGDKLKRQVSVLSWSRSR